MQNMNRWMNKLSYHYQKMSHLFPDDRLIILFDIDGTIVDTRYMVLHALNSFDQIHGTSYFTNWTFLTSQCTRTGPRTCLNP